MPLRDDILNPIPGDNPCGEDLRYAPIYDQIKEARREDDDVAQGVWKTTRKVADWQQVQKLASEALAKKSKDLQLAAWLTEALVYREGFEGLLSGLTLIRSLLEQYWDNLYPELEDGDSEMRSVPLAYIVSKVDLAMRRVPLTTQGVDWVQYKDAIAIPTEEEANDSAKRAKRAEAEQEGKLLPEDVDSALKQTPAAFFDEMSAHLKSIREELEVLDGLCREKFEDYTPNYSSLRDCLDQIENTVRILGQRKGSGPAQAAAAKPVAKKAAPSPEPSAASASSWDPFADDEEETAAQAEPAETEEEPASSFDPFSDEEDAAPAPAASPARDPFDEDEDEGETSAPTASSRGSATRGGTLSAEPADEADAVHRICQSALWLRNQNPKSPAPYLLLRALRFGELSAGGENPDWALLEAAPLEVRQRLKLCSMEQNWEALLEACEEAMALPCGRAWLDLQRYAVQALEGLGEEYAQVLSAVRSELKNLLAEHPSLPEMMLNDDTPTANRQTQQFLRDEGLIGDSVPKPKSTVREQTDEDIINEAIRAKKFEVALATVMRCMKRETSGRGRFERKVQQARILMEAKRNVVAYPILRELSAEIFERRLDEWEPSSLVVEPLMLLHQCLQDDGDEAEEKQKIYELICRLDPVRAFELQ